MRRLCPGSAHGVVGDAASETLGDSHKPRDIHPIETVSVPSERAAKIVERGLTSPQETHTHDDFFIVLCSCSML